ncbi:hypothetical protein [Pilimelia anulata]|nr:hypothetical protein [Pilimelia anulata]
MENGPEKKPADQWRNLPDRPRHEDLVAETGDAAAVNLATSGENQQDWQQEPRG